MIISVLGRRNKWVDMYVEVESLEQMLKLLNDYRGAFIDFQADHEAKLARECLEFLPLGWRREVENYIRAYEALRDYGKDGQ
jgi:hypothetical protein